MVIDACHSGDGTRGDNDEVVRGVEDTLVVDSLNARGLYETFEMLKSLFMGDYDKEKSLTIKLSLWRNDGLPSVHAEVTK